jgi:hypothetical protein
VKLKCTKPEPISEWSSRPEPPAINASQKLMTLPSIAYGIRTDCFNPTACAALAPSSNSVPKRTCADGPTDVRARNTESAKEPEPSVASRPTAQSRTSAGPSAPMRAPGRSSVRAPETREPGPMITPGAMRSDTTSASMKTDSGEGINTPRSRSLRTASCITGSW